MRAFVRIVSLVLAVPAFGLYLFVLNGSPTWSGMAYSAGLLATTLGGALLGRRWAPRLAAGGGVVLALTILVRVFTAARGNTLVMRTGASPGPRLVDRLIDEADLAVSAARTLGFTSFRSDPDVSVLPREMSSAYARMRAEQGDAPSPVLATYLGSQTPSAYDSIEIGDVEGASGVVVFLHGFAGSFSLPCWEVSRAAVRAGMATVCPATRWVGDWWSAEGEATVQDLAGRLRARGQRHLILAGLSNGAIGGSLLLPRMPGVFEGFIAISGASPAAPAPGVPVLCIQGTRDATIPASIVGAYATRAGGKYVALDAGHFALLVTEDVAVDAMASWLAQRPKVAATD